MSLFSAAKDGLVKAAAKEFFNRRFQSIGTMTDIQIDSSAKRVEAVVNLVGETQPLRVVISPYELIEREGKPFLIVRGFQSSRPWLTNAVREFLLGKEVQVPSEVKMAL
jgi:hypothetical protein